MVSSELARPFSLAPPIALTDNPNIGNCALRLLCALDFTKLLNLTHVKITYYPLSLAIWPNYLSKKDKLGSMKHVGSIEHVSCYLYFKISESFTLLSVAKFKFPINKAVKPFVPVLQMTALRIL